MPAVKNFKSAPIPYLLISGSFLSEKRWISDRNINPNKLAGYLQLSYCYSLKIAKLYVINVIN